MYGFHGLCLCECLVMGIDAQLHYICCL